MRGSSERLTLAPVYRSAMFCMLKRPRGLVERLAARVVVAGGSQHPVDDALISSATAEVAGQSLADFGFRRIGRFAEEGGDLHEESRCAEAALESVRVPHGLLQWVELAALSQALDGEDVCSARLHREHETGTGGFPVDEDGAGPAHPVLAAEVCPGEPEVLPQEVGEGPPRLHRPSVHRAVDRELDLNGAHAASHARCAATDNVRWARTPARC